MKRKLCLALALAMVLSMFASMSVFAELNTFNPNGGQNFYIEVADVAANTANSLGYSGRTVKLVKFMIDGNADNGFSTLDANVHFDNTKYEVAINKSNQKPRITVMSATRGGVLLDFPIGFDDIEMMDLTASALYETNVIQGEGTDSYMVIVAASSAYTQAEGIIFQAYVVVAEDYTPTDVANDFSIEINQLCGSNSTTEGLAGKYTVANPYVPGGAPAPVTKDITVTYGEGGSVAVNGSAVNSGYVVTVGENETVSADIVPADGYYCSSYVLDGATVENTEVGSITGLTVNNSLSVVFAAIPVLDPVISQETKVDDTYYAEIANFENIGDLDYGFKLTVTRKVVRGLTIERPNEVYFCSVKGKNGANTLGQFGAIIEILNATECDYTVEAIITAAVTE